MHVSNIVPRSTAKALKLTPPPVNTARQPPAAKKTVPIKGMFTPGDCICSRVRWLGTVFYLVFQATFSHATNTASVLYLRQLIMLPETHYELINVIISD